MSGRLPVIPNGLDVAQQPSKHWAVRHLASATFVVSYCPTRAAAYAAAEALGPVADWTRSREELAADGEVQRAIRRVGREAERAARRRVGR